ncbi:MAG: YdeI/OmpD-associated family protein [Gemmatimonadota bacterium]
MPKSVSAHSSATTGNPPRETFTVVLKSAGKTATGFEVPPAVVARLGTSKKPPVRVTINGHTYRNTVAVMGGKFMIGVSAENREKAGVAAGDRLSITLELDTEPRVVTVPADLTAALSRDSKARLAFEKLSHSRKSGIVLNIEGANTEETRQRRIEKSLATLREN